MTIIAVEKYETARELVDAMCDAAGDDNFVLLIENGEILGTFVPPDMFKRILMKQVVDNLTK